MLLSLLLLIHDIIVLVISPVMNCLSSYKQLHLIISVLIGRVGVVFGLVWFVRFLFFLHPLNLCKYAENPRTTNSFKSNGQKVKMALASLLVRHIAERRSSVYI